MPSSVSSRTLAPDLIFDGMEPILNCQWRIGKGASSEIENKKSPGPLLRRPVLQVCSWLRGLSRATISRQGASRVKFAAQGGFRRFKQPFRMVQCKTKTGPDPIAAAQVCGTTGAKDGFHALTAAV